MDMENSIELENINYQWKEKVLFENLNWQIENGSFTTLLGKSGCGKTTLLKMIAGYIKCHEKIKVENLLLNEKNLLSIRSKIGFVFENPEKNIIADTVKEDILFSISSKKYSTVQLEKKLFEIAQLLEINPLLEKKTSQLSEGEKQLVALAGVLMKEAKILILDNAFSMVDRITKNKILKYLKVLNREKKITILYATNDIEDSIYGNSIALLGDKKIKFYGKNNFAFKQEELFLEEGFELPFMVQLSSKLKYYNLIKGQILDMNKMVDQIWK